MNKTVIVGFGYRARSGKDSACNAIIEAYKDKFDIRKYGLGDALKAEVNGLDQLELCMRQGIQYDFDAPMDDPLCQTKHGKQRRLLQWYGTEYMRAKDPFHWLHKLDARIKADAPQFALINDIRMTNEYYYVVAKHGVTVKISRQGFADLSTNPDHTSETQLDGYQFDYELNVLDGEIEELKKDAVTLFQMIVDAQTPNVAVLEETSVAA